MTIKALIAAAAIVTPTGAGAVIQPAPPVSPDRESPAKNNVAQRALTDEDYWRPLDSWLKANGSPLSGKDFYEVGAAYRIDPDMLIAITKAETNLGKVQQRGSQFNVGSVGSYDSTNTTIVAASYRHGIEQIAQTLNNALLGGYTTVGQLSRAHNPSGHVYASSPANWERGVVATLSALKGHAVDHTYQFRK